VSSPRGIVSMSCMVGACGRNIDLSGLVRPPFDQECSLNSQRAKLVRKGPFSQNDASPLACVGHPQASGTAGAKKSGNTSVVLDS